MQKETTQPCSIIVTNYDGKHLLEQCLPSVVEAARRHNPQDEIIVVDDCSNDDSREFLSEHFPSLKVVANPANMGFQRASNIGAYLAKFPVIVMLNNDIAVEPDAILRLCAYFDRYEGLFAVSAKLFGWDRNTFLAGRRIARFEEGHFRLGNVDGDQAEPVLTLFATGGAAAFNREQFLELRGFDSIYHPLYWEDIDLCYRAHKRGWLVLYAPDAIMYHKHQATIQKTTDPKRLRLITARNSYIFFYKNILDSNMLRQHILRSAHFFIRDSFRGHFRFQRAFLMTLSKLPGILVRRRQERKARLLPDMEVIERIAKGCLKQA